MVSNQDQRGEGMEISEARLLDLLERAAETGARRALEERARQEQIDEGRRKKELLALIDRHNGGGRRDAR